MAHLILPRVQAMVLCDHVEESSDELETFDLSGVRTDIRASSFPHVYPKLFVFAHMSGHAGIAMCRVAVNQPSTDVVIRESPSREIFFDGPTSVVPVIFRLRNCSFPSAGVYYVQMYHEAKLIGERPLFLVESPEP